MRRREILAASGALTSSLVGCLGRGSPGDGEASTAHRESPTPDTEVSIPDPTGECGTAATPQSDQFVQEGGGPPACFEGAMAPLAIENERDEETVVEVDIASDGDSVFAESYTLTPAERVVERGVLPAHDDHEASVAVDGGEPVSGGWEGTSCYRHGVSVGPDGVEFGLVPPLAGPGDTEHDCYSGDSVDVTVYNSEESNTVTVSVVDHCKERVHDRTMTLEPDEVERVRQVLANGGIYDVIADVEGGGAARYAFYNECWGVTAGIDDGGDVSVRQVLID